MADLFSVGAEGQPTSGTILAPLARTASPFTAAATPALAASGAIGNTGGNGVLVYINTTAFGTSSTTFAIEGYDPASATWYPILTSAAISANSLIVLRVHPGATVTANLSANDVLPATWRVRPIHANANSHTYSVGATVVAA